MNQCAWCKSTESTKRWCKARINQRETICHSCYRSSKNHYTACALCKNRRLCHLVSDRLLCLSCISTKPIDTVMPICIKCKTTKSMSWHTNETGDTVCLFCYKEEEEEEEVDVIAISSDEEDKEEKPVSRKRKSKRKRSNSSRNNIITRSRCGFDNDDVEEAAHLLYHLILTVNKA